MAEEIERKFLVRNDDWRAQVRQAKRYRQGYLAVNEQCGVRVRVAGDRATLNIKSAGLDIQRLEFEYAIPLADANELLDRLCQGREVSKTRHLVDHGGHTWEVDEFLGDNEGLIVAEIELRARDEQFARPDWLGPEVSGEARYLNSNLAEQPFRTWQQ